VPLRRLRFVPHIWYLIYTFRKVFLQNTIPGAWSSLLPAEIEELVSKLLTSSSGFSVQYNALKEPYQKAFEFFTHIIFNSS
jgi:hypothetical protein